MVNDKRDYCTVESQLNHTVTYKKCRTSSQILKPRRSQVVSAKSKWYLHAGDIVYDTSNCDAELNRSEDKSSPVADRSVECKKDTKTIVALDCEMVGVGREKRSALGRVSIVGYDGEVLYDNYVQPNEDITDYRTRWSGIRECNMKTAISMRQAQQEVYSIIHDKIVVGHALKHDFQVLQLTTSPKSKRDTVNYVWLRTLAGLRLDVKPSLKLLAKLVLNKEIQNGEHCSVEDARTAMEIYHIVSDQWEKEMNGYYKSYMNDEYWPMKLLNKNGLINTC